MLLRETPSKLPGQNAHVLPGLHPAQGFKFKLATKSTWFVGGQTSPPPQEGELSPFSVSQARGALQIVPDTWVTTSCRSGCRRGCKGLFCHHHGRREFVGTERS